MLRIQKNLLPIFLFLALALAACSSGTSETIPTEIPLVPTISLVEPSPEPAKILYFLTNTDPSNSLRVQSESALQSFSDANDIDFQIASDSNSVDFSLSSSNVIIFGEFANLSELISSQPDTRFIYIDPPADFAEASNLTTLSIVSNQSEIAAFLAGYAAALSTEQWSIAALFLASDNTEALAFIAGVEYFCGACVSELPPETDYPFAYLTELGTWQNQAQEISNQRVSTVYLSPNLNQPEIYEFFSSRGMLIIGSNYPGEALSSAWLATISPRSQSSLIEDLISLLVGEPLASNASSVMISESNSAYLSIPRIEHLQAILADIDAGFLGMPSQID